MQTAFIAKIDKIEFVEGANTICRGYVLGTQIVIGKESKVGDIGIFFPSELQLSEEYCFENSLFRHSNLNKDNTKKSYFEDNRRVRSQPFLGIKSDGFFTSLESLSYTKYDISKLKVGDTTTELNGKVICQKYYNERTLRAISNRQKQNQKKKEIKAPFFKEHLDTKQAKHYIDSIPVNSLVSIVSKSHGTSGRVSYTKIIHSLNKFKSLINKVIPIFKTESYEYITGSRRCVLYPDKDKGKVGFHGSEQYRWDILDSLKPYLTKDMTIYFEIVGFVNGKPIMPIHDVTKLKDKRMVEKYGKSMTYKYGCKPHEYKVKIYRITFTTQNNESIDFTQSQLEDWCGKRGLFCCKPIVAPFIYDGNKENLTKLIERLTEREDELGEDYLDSECILEGIVLRFDCGELTPLFLKNKNYCFKLMEGIVQEGNEIDCEEVS